MNQTLPEDDKLFEEALDLIIRLQNDPANPITHELVRRWRARGPDREAAWAEVMEIHGMAGKVLTDQRKTELAVGSVSRRKVILGGAAAFIAAGIGAYYGPDALIRVRADHVTSTAELRRITLPDGTVLTLGPDSAIRTDFKTSVRRIELLSGMAFFEVAKDPARPFQGIIDHLTVTALGTAFDIGKDAGLLTVSVDHGRVEVAVPNSPLSSGSLLDGGDWLSLDESSREVERGKRDVGQIAAWRDGMIVAEREAISFVVARIGRWYSGRIIIADLSFGTQRISGVFDLNNPVMALEAVVHPYGGKVRRISPWLTVISSI
jgi:transmembrane sensor